VHENKRFIKKIINDWNPIDLFPGAPDDEYWTEIEAIEHILRDTDNPVKLGEGIYAVFVKEFDDTFKKSKAECGQIAQVILSQKTVKRIIDDWDPIDLFPGAPDDEYWTEIEAIEHILRDTDNPVKLGEGIYAVFVKEFDDTFKRSKAECGQIAQMIFLEKNTAG